MIAERRAWSAPVVKARSPTDDDGLAIVVNYFTSFATERSHRLLVSSTSTSLQMLVANPAVTRVLLVDGSRESDAAIAAACNELDVEYYHHGQQISYVRAYNIGWRRLHEPYIGLMANDIIPHPPETLDRLLAWIKQPDVGCTFPYFSSSHAGGDEVQRVGFAHRGNITCEPATMTLNLNLFKRSVLERINGLDEKYLYGFAEPILLLKIRSLGFRAVMVGGTHVFHYDKLTKALGESSLSPDIYLGDVRRWFGEYAKYAASPGLANIDLRRWPFSTTRRSKLLWSLCHVIPFARLQAAMMCVVMWLEPFLTRYPASGGIRPARTERAETANLPAGDV